MFLPVQHLLWQRSQLHQSCNFKTFLSARVHKIEFISTATVLSFFEKYDV